MYLGVKLQYVEYRQVAKVNFHLWEFPERVTRQGQLYLVASNAPRLCDDTLDLWALLKGD